MGTDFIFKTIPVLAVLFGLVIGLFVAVYHSWDRKRAHIAAEEHYIEMQAGHFIVDVVDSNNDFPGYGNKLTAWISFMEQQQIAPHTNLRGCATGGQ